MSHRSSLDRLPQHLECHVVEQAYEQYHAVDQAVWRFVLLQLSHRLRGRAHEAYEAGLASSGIALDRIPNIREMDALLGRFGWGAVCVDGFIPPRAFTEFQELGILPIAADMRSLEHLVYTPAPDIIHEAAGHAPILSHQAYAHFLRKIGGVGARAFRSAADASLYQAIFELSEANEDPAVGDEERRKARLAFEAAQQNLGPPSEAARVSRLYWWTAEYGLLGSPEEYRLYGAGLLSSLWESHSCHAPSVLKLPLTRACVDVAYDVTQEQPQLFVARDFAHLEEVVDEVETELSTRRGGVVGLRVALESPDCASLHFASALRVTGTLSELWGGLTTEPWLARLDGPVTLRAGGERSAPRTFPEGLFLLGGGRGKRATIGIEEAMHHPLDGRDSLRGRILGRESLASGHTLLTLGDARLAGAGSLNQGAPLALLCVESPHSVRAETPPLVGSGQSGSRPRAPRERRYPPRERQRIALYDEAMAVAHSNLGSAQLTHFQAIHQKLCHEFPEEWLLRWNLLESLRKLDSDHELSHRLQRELEALEEAFERREPIASGLAYLGIVAQSRASQYPI